MTIEKSRFHTFFLIAVAILFVDQVGCGYLRSPESSSSVGSLALSSHSAENLKLRSDGQFQVETVKELAKIFEDFDLTQTKAVPRLYLAKLPGKPKAQKHAKKGAKALFVKAVLPHILQVNEGILADRTRLLELQEKQVEGKRLTPGEKLWLSKLASHYRCSSKIRTLLKHVDVVPPSLALAQGALESGWGKSPAALAKNSTFGHMATKKKVMAFESLLHNVTAYIHNLNRHVAYAGFRDERATLRQQGHTLCGYTLAPQLKKYSVRGTAYTKDLQHFITNHKFKKYDSASLAATSL